MLDDTTVEYPEFVPGGTGLETVEVVFPAVMDETFIEQPDVFYYVVGNMNTNEGHSMKRYRTDG